MKTFAAAIMLAIGAHAGAYANPYAGAELHSLQTYKYGKFVASMKPSMLRGTGSAFYLYGRDNDEEYQHVFKEWNSMLILPSHHHEPIITRISKDQLKEQGDWDSHIFAGDRDDFHTYTIEWTPDYIAYYVDGTEYRRNDEVSLLQDDELNLAFAITALEGDEMGNPDTEKLPTYTHIDYVEVYSYDETNQSFELNFRDDFDSFNDDRWDVANNNTWKDLSSYFKKENVSFKDGHLLLKLTKSGHDDDSDDDDDDDHDDFHVLPAPKDGTLDQAIEKATRVAVTMVRTYLDEFSENMAHYLNQ